MNNMIGRKDINAPFRSEYPKVLATKDRIDDIPKMDMYDIAYKQGYQKAITDMLDLSYEWRDNHGSFLDFQRVLRSKLN